MAFSRSLAAVHGSTTRSRSSIGCRAGVTLGLLSVLVAAPAWAGNSVPQRNMLSSSRSSTSMGSSSSSYSNGSNSRGSSPLKVSIPGIGGRRLDLSYSGPIAPWKVLNPMLKGERQGSISVKGPNTVKGQSVHTVSFTAAHESGVRSGGMTVSSARAGAGSSESKSLNVGTSVEHKGLSAQASHHATFDAQKASANGSDSRLSVSASVTTSRPEHGSSSTTGELRAQSTSQRVGAGGIEHETRSGAVQSTKIGNQTTHEASASRNLTRANGQFQEHGASVRVGAQAAAGEQRTIVAKIGQVTGRDGVTEKGDGAIVTRGANGDMSSRLVTGGENRTRSVTLGDQTRRQGFLARFKSGVVGEKSSAETSFKNGVPVAD